MIASSPDQETMLKAGSDEVHYGLWVKILSDEEYPKIVDVITKNEQN